MKKKYHNRQFKKNSNGLFILYNRITFWEFFKMLRKNNYESEEAINYISTKCYLSALVLQECIHNKKYKRV